jgi:outer membrane protein OmpA-like peptidoglycan-associated protein
MAEYNLLILLPIIRTYQETSMFRIVRLAMLCLIAVAVVPVAFGQEDAEGTKDYPGISRMPGYYIRSCGESQFDSYAFTVVEGKHEKQQTLEGHKYDYRYELKDNATPASALQIIRNYQNAVRGVGGQVLREVGEGTDRETTLRFNKGDKEVWLAVRGMSSADRIIFLTIIEKQVMQQDVTVTAASMASDIANSGSVALYGIYFDTGKSDLKPESAPAIAEIAKLLKQEPALRIFVVGHTDMVGDVAANMKLSQARAQSVVNALVSQHGVASSRLSAFGNGSYAPKASNKTEEGRAKNRRVELVEIATK